MMDDKGFDLWADGYDRSVGLSDEDGSYPFAGYRAVLGAIYRRVLEVGRGTVLDIGFGTGTLSARLYGQGCAIFGQDFSRRMVELAREKMPEAQLFHGDFSKGLAQPLTARRYDAIIATYSLHHLTDEEKVSFLGGLRSLLREDGRIYVGDVAFANREALERCREQVGEEWDDEEVYFVADELQRALPGLSFEPMSHCAGLFTLGR